MFTISDRLKLPGTLLYDGSMGAVLSEYVPAGALTDTLNLTNDNAVYNLHRRFIEAGSTAIQTNTFQANPVTLKRYDLGKKAKEINRHGASIAKLAAGRDAYVGGSIGPIITFLWEECGELTAEQVREACKPQIEGLAEGGVDFLHLETMVSRREVEAILDVACREAPGVPVIVTMSFTPRYDEGGKLIYHRTDCGVSPANLSLLARNRNLLAYGANCGSGPATAEELMRELMAGDYNSRLVAKLNVGMPPDYAEPEAMADYAERMAGLGVKIIGGCCGTTPTHVEVMARRLGTLA